MCTACVVHYSFITVSSPIQVSLTKSITPRYRHVGGVIHVSDTRRLLVVNGGISDTPWKYDLDHNRYPLISDTKVIELGKSQFITDHYSS